MVHGPPHPPPSKDTHQECWHIFYSDVHVRIITERAGVPHDVDHGDGTAVSIL
jgi:hypothetical protein